MRWLFRKLFFEQWQAINAEARAERAADGERWDWRPLIALVICAVDLTLHEYFGDRDYYSQFMHRSPDELGAFAWWSGWRGIGYGIIPMSALLLQRQRLSEYGLSLRGFIRHAWIYGALFGAVLPFVIGASFTHAFQHTYPFYKGAARSWSEFWAWEGLYAFQFLTLEFFFRGFLLFSLRRAMGAYAIFAMVVPYCMIHYHKPIAEVLGAIFAGIVLGTLALRTRSIWFGVAIHVSVAFTMDVLSLLHWGSFPPGR
ncbi:MAG TPA: CPBP family intramembrane glutamic endopeptidase [Polyangia bacterium]|nr:CPBP family intramembrane glutamic endopeptidase [Polyangia bacterium]